MEKQKELHLVVLKINTIFLKNFPDAIILDYGIPNSNPRKQKIFLITLKYILQGEAETSYFEKFSYYLYDVEKDIYVHLQDFLGEKPEISMLMNFVSFETKEKTSTFRFTNQDVKTLKED